MTCKRIIFKKNFYWFIIIKSTQIAFVDFKQVETDSTLKTDF